MNKNILNILTSWKVIAAVMVAAAIIFLAATFVAKGNADYICTRVIDDESACAIDEWSQWSDATTQDPESVGEPGSTYEVEQTRVGTGTKVLSQVIEYINRRTACVAGFTSTSAGTSGGGAGGYNRDGKTFTRNAVCQIGQSRTVTRRVPGGDDDPECISVGDAGCNDHVSEIITVETVGTTTSGGNGDPQTLDGITAINDFRHSMIKAEITVVPALLHDGDTTVVKWNSRETTECTVSGDNGDGWSPVTEVRDQNTNTIITLADNRTAGTEESKQITTRTVYTLTCTAFDGSTVADTAVVDRIPEWQEN